jgi:alanine racemase
MIRGAIAKINLNALEHNYKIAKKITQNRPVIAVVKADAYGHGAVEISRKLSLLGADYLAVAFSEEAKELRDSQIESPIIVLFDCDLRDIFKYNLIPVIYDKRSVRFLSKEAEKYNKTIDVHIKIDTGMGRLGFSFDDACKEIMEIANLRNINIQGIMSHFSEANNPDVSFSIEQIKRFKKIRERLFEEGLKIKNYHIANSAAILSLSDSYFDSVRPGIMLYGYTSLKRDNFKNLLRPVMSIVTNIISLRKFKKGTPISYGRSFITKRDSLIGVVKMGYADGFSRILSNCAYVIVKGKRVPVVGMVCMDLMMVDLTGLEDIKEQEEVVIVGRQGNESIDADELAFWAKTIPYEVLTSLGNRASRIYED